MQSWIVAQRSGRRRTWPERLNHVLCLFKVIKVEHRHEVATFNLTNSLTVSAGSTCGGFVATNGDLVERYYAAILRRASDVAGKAYWIGEADRLCALAADPKETFFVLANTFYNSPEYLAFNRDDNAFVTDLYITFLGRLPDAGGLAYWRGQIAGGMPRNLVVSSFLFSPEYSATMNGVFPGKSARRNAPPTRRGPCRRKSTA